MRGAQFEEEEETQETKEHKAGEDDAGSRRMRLVRLEGEAAKERLDEDELETGNEK